MKIRAVHWVGEVLWYTETILKNFKGEMMILGMNCLNGEL